MFKQFGQQADIDRLVAAGQFGSAANIEAGIDALFFGTSPGQLDERLIDVDTPVTVAALCPEKRLRAGAAADIENIELPTLWKRPIDAEQSLAGNPEAL